MEKVISNSGVIIPKGYTIVSERNGKLKIRDVKTGEELYWIKTVPALKILKEKYEKYLGISKSKDASPKERLAAQKIVSFISSMKSEILKNRGIFYCKDTDQFLA